MAISVPIGMLEVWVDAQIIQRGTSTYLALELSKMGHKDTGSKSQHFGLHKTPVCVSASGWIKTKQ